MDNLTIKCFPAIDTANIERRTLILNCEYKALDHWLLRSNNRSSVFSFHLSAHWFKYQRKDGHIKHYLTNDEQEVKKLLRLVSEDKNWSYSSFLL